jgi:hypothetical protein
VKRHFVLIDIRRFADGTIAVVSYLAGNEV